jgi:hypothetical protein
VKISDIECDLVIRGGTVVTTGSSAECDVGPLDGKVVQLGGSLRGLKRNRVVAARYDKLASCGEYGS